MAELYIPMTQDDDGTSRIWISESHNQNQNRGPFSIRWTRLRTLVPKQAPHYETIEQYEEEYILSPMREINIQSRTSPLHAQFSFDDCSVPLNFFKYITSDSSLRLSQQPYSRFFPPTEWCCLCDPLISVLVKYCRFPFLYTVTSRFSGSTIH